MPNDFYTPTSNPTDNSAIVSTDMRAEFAAINAGFNKLPTLTGNANKLVVINSSGTGMDVTVAPEGLTSINKIALTQPANGATFTLLDGKTLTVNHSLTLAGTDSTTMTFPATSASVARIDAAQTFVGTQTFSGLIAANLGLTVAGAAFNSRGITDNATAKALTLSGSGANSVTIANSATNPIIGTTGGGLTITPNTGVLTLNGAAVGVSANLIVSCTGANGAGIQLTGNGATTTSKYIRVLNGNLEIVNDAYSSGIIQVTDTGIMKVATGTAIPAGGGQAFGLSSTATMGIYFGSGDPTVSAAKGSIYLRSDGTTTSNRMYVNTDGSTAWTAVTTAA